MTDTGRTAELLDLAARAWPEMEGRKALLMRLAEAGAAVAEQDLREAAAAGARRREAMLRSRELIDAAVLLSDQPWA